jgi:hypothetical protein
MNYVVRIFAYTVLGFMFAADKPEWSTQKLHKVQWKNWHNSLSSEVLTEMFMKSSIFCDITPCISLKVSGHFRAINQHEVGRKKNICFLAASCWFLACLTLQPWSWRRHILSKRRLVFNGIHRVISQKIELFMHPSADIYLSSNDTIIWCAKILCYIFTLPGFFREILSFRRTVFSLLGFFREIQGFPQHCFLNS